MKGTFLSCTCPICDYICSSKKSFSSHMSKSHPDVSENTKRGIPALLHVSRNAS